MTLTELEEKLPAKVRDDLLLLALVEAEHDAMPPQTANG